MIVAALCCPGLSGEAQAVSLVGQQLRFARFGYIGAERVDFDNATFQVADGIEHVTLGFLTIDVSADRIVFSHEGLDGGLPFAYSSVFEFELLSSLLFAGAGFAPDLSTFSGSLDSGRIDVEGALLRVDMRGLTSTFGASLVTRVQVIPEPNSGILFAIGLFSIAATRQSARRVTTDHRKATSPS